MAKKDLTSTTTPPTETFIGYDDLLRDIKARVQTARVRASLAVNNEVVVLYRGIGRDLSLRMRQHGWGAKVIDLKTGAFKPEYAGKMNFYLAVVDEKLRHPDDAPSIGLILCRDKEQIVAEYALRNMAAPIGVSEYQTTETLPESLKSSLPAV